MAKDLFDRLQAANKPVIIVERNFEYPCYFLWEVKDKATRDLPITLTNRAGVEARLKSIKRDFAWERSGPDPTDITDQQYLYIGVIEREGFYSYAWRNEGFAPYEYCVDHHHVDGGWLAYYRHHGWDHMMEYIRDEAISSHWWKKVNRLKNIAKRGQLGERGKARLAAMLAAKPKDDRIVLDGARVSFFDGTDKQQLGVVLSAVKQKGEWVCQLPKNRPAHLSTKATATPEVAPQGPR